MILVADSGSTKTKWCLRGQGTEKIFRTDGINPYYQTPEEIEQSIRQQLLPVLGDENIESLYFYGAGVSGEKQVNDVLLALKACFPKAFLLADHDLIGAARAALGNQAGIVCIAGTGSNSCYYDGNEILQNVDSLGLYLGDEGSGGFKGRLLIRDYMRGGLPSDLKEDFEKDYPDRKPDIMERVYRQPFPNRYLASFVPFIAKHSKDLYMKELVTKSFSAFAEECLMKYPMHKEVEIHFIGSVAITFRDVLEYILKRNNMQLGSVLADPLPALANFHVKLLS